jgi:hypothetical protein
MIEFDLSAFEETFGDTLVQLEEGIAEDVLRATGFAGAAVFREEAKRNARGHAKTFTIYNSIIVYRVEEESDGGSKQVYIVTVRQGRFNGDDAFYWEWVEKGHKFVPPNRKVSKKTGRTVGWKAHRAAAELEYGSATVPAYPYMRPAYESKKHEAVDVMTKTLIEQLKRNLGGG